MLHTASGDYIHSLPLQTSKPKPGVKSNCMLSSCDHMRRGKTACWSSTMSLVLGGWVRVRVRVTLTHTEKPQPPDQLRVGRVVTAARDRKACRTHTHTDVHIWVAVLTLSAVSGRDDQGEGMNLLLLLPTGRAESPSGCTWLCTKQLITAGICRYTEQSFSLIQAPSSTVSTPVGIEGCTYAPC